ncbi:MAG: DMT family transporter [Alphaproteobacteria bacterium]|nr:MAG: DMT family transporter [Alphaproteobacteria bacterium]
MDWRAIAMGTAFALMWSSAFTSARIIVADAPPLTALALRFAISGLLAVGIAAAAGQSFRLTRAQLAATLVFGLCQNALYLGLNFVAMQWIEASLAAIIASMLPLLVALGARFAFGERIGWLGIAGLAAGFGGAALIMGQRLGGGAVDPLGVGLALGGVLALAVATLTLRGAASGGNVMMVVGYQMLVGSAVLALAALALERGAELRPSWPLAIAFAYTTLVPGVLATWVWFRLVGRIGATRAATFHFLNPFLAVAIAALVLGERVGPADALGVAVIAAGILAVQIARARPAPGRRG